jgi:hypothetical protein
MELQEIEVVIDEDGETQIEVRGVKGTSCLELTEDLEAALGGEVEEREMTPEADEQSVQTQQEQWLGGSS